MSSSSGPAHWYKRPGVIITLAVLVIIGIVIALVLPSHTPSSDKAAPTTDTTTASSSASPIVGVQAPSQATDTPVTSINEDELSPEYADALQQARLFVDILPYSYDRLYEQLVAVSDGHFSEEAARWAVDHVSANWNEEALEAATNYRDEDGMTKDQIYDTLIRQDGDRFTKEQAQYAVDNL